MRLTIFRIMSAILLVFWMCCIFTLSAQNATSSSDLSHSFIETALSKIYPGFTDIDELERLDLVSSLQFVTRKMAHFSAYGLLGILSFLTIISYNRLKICLRYATSAGICLLYAVSDEIHQLYVPGRSGELRDVLIDFSGGIAGILFCILIRILLCKRSSKQN